MLFCAAISYGSTAASDNKNNAVIFDIAAQPLRSALVDFVNQAQIGVVADSNVDLNIICPAVRQHSDPERALKSLIAQQELRLSRAVQGYFVIQLPPTQSDQATNLPIQRPAAMEEVFVTGPLLSHAQANKLHQPLRLFREDFALQSEPSLIDVVANLAGSAGSDNHSNQFDNGNNEGTSQINLRGLGVNRTLVTINGRRMVRSAVNLADGQAFTDLNILPTNLIERLEIINSGASTITGDDAVAGVVNIVTKKIQPGISFWANHKTISDTPGDSAAGINIGWRNTEWELGLSLAFNHRSELNFTDRSRITTPAIDLEDLDVILYGQSSFGNPGAFIPLNSGLTPTLLNRDSAALASNNRDSYVRDPNCTEAGGFNSTGNRCGFRYTVFDNLVEEENRQQLFAQLSYRPSRQHQFHGELLVNSTKVPNWNSSPSYPPLTEADPNRALPANHPGLLQLLEQFPELQQLDGQAADFSGGAIFVGRPVGINGPASVGRRGHDTGRLSLNYLWQQQQQQIEINLLHARSRNIAETSDVLITRFRDALLGLGGANCNSNTPGLNGCEYYNPFSSALAISPNFDPLLANSTELLNWLREDISYDLRQQLSVINVDYSNDVTLFNHPLSINAGLELQWHQKQYGLGEFGDLTRNPGDADGGFRPGVFGFLRGGVPGTQHRRSYSAYGQATVPLNHDISLQAGLRHTAYNQGIGHATSPALAASWKLNDLITSYASIQYAFRPPSLTQSSDLENSGTQFVGSSLAFKAVDRFASDNLSGEKARNITLGVDLSFDSSQIKLSVWDYQVKDAIVAQNANEIAIYSNLFPNSKEAQQVLRDPSGEITRIALATNNGPNINVRGADVKLQWFSQLGQWPVTAGLDASYLQHYKQQATATQGAFDAAGKLNAGNFLKALPHWRSNLFVGTQYGNHQMQLQLHYVSGFTDDGLDILQGSSVAASINQKRVPSWTTIDFNYLVKLSHYQTDISLTINNLFDRRPPRIRDDIRFETSVHNAYGRTVQMSFNHKI